MKFINCSYEDFKEKVINKNIIMFGASSAWHYYFSCFSNIKEIILDNTVFIVDNDEKKQGKQFQIGEYIFKICNPLKIEKRDDCVILITVSLAYQKSICEQLMLMKLPDTMECYSLPLMTYSIEKNSNECVEHYFENRETKKIPAIIHSFWFSKDEKTDLYKKCIESWYKFCPEFEIIEWNVENYDVTQCQYTREAFEHKKWAFISDFARLDVINSYGGVYMDMDVELISSLDYLLYADSFFNRQEDGIIDLGSGFGAQPGDKLVSEMLNTYKNRKLVNKDGSIDMTPQPEWLSSVWSRYGITRCHDSKIIDGSLILSNDYISCGQKNANHNKPILGYHWHNGGWLDDTARKLIADSLQSKDDLLKRYFYTMG